MEPPDQGAFLKDFHARNPGCTRRAFAPWRLEEGVSSYECGGNGTLLRAVRRRSRARLHGVDFSGA